MKCRLGDLARVSSSKRIYAKEYTTSGIPFYRGKEIIELGSGHLVSNKLFISKDRFNQIRSKYDDVPEKDDVLITAVGTIGETYLVKSRDLPFYFKDGNLIKLSKWNRQIVLPEYMYYWLNSYTGKMAIKKITIGSTQQAITIRELSDIELDLPPIREQGKIAQRLSTLDFSIDNNKHINANLLELAKTLFSEEFSSNEEVLLSNYLLPKRGKNLLKKNVVSGEFPVIAGGLKPAAFHNSYNTKAPVITISASGANAGYVQIWGQPVWSSDSSYIDTSITKDIYFWYLLLKKYQKQIFDAQTGSAQPHIYPKHIGNLLIPNISEDSIKNFNITITPIFKKIFQNKNENNKLKAIKNSLSVKYFN